VTGACGHKATIHLAIEHASGNSAIVEYINGKPVIHHRPERWFMTNDSAYGGSVTARKTAIGHIESSSDG